MTPAEALYAAMQADAAVVAALGNRIYPVATRDPQPAFAVVTQVGRVRQRHLGGNGGRTLYRFTIDVWAREWSDAVEAAAPVAALLEACDVARSLGAFAIMDLAIEDEVHGYQPEPDLFSVTISVTIGVRE
jgi:hypothetical protein